MIDKLNQNQIEELLSKQLIGRIGCHAEGITYVVPISYAYHQDFIYAHTYEGMKMEVMRKNPEVCFEVDDTQDTSNWKSVIAWGTFEELHDPAERDEALQVLNNRILPLNSSVTTHLGSGWPFTYNEKGGVDGIFFRIRLQNKTGRFESNQVTPAFSF